MALKLVLKWIYDPDIERLANLQEKHVLIEKELNKIDSSYQQAIKSIQ